MQVSLGDPAAGVEPIDLPFSSHLCQPMSQQGEGGEGGKGREESSLGLRRRAGRRTWWTAGPGASRCRGRTPSPGRWWRFARGGSPGAYPRRTRTRESGPRRAWRRCGIARPQCSARHRKGLPLLFGAGAVKGRVTRGAESIFGDLVQHLGRHQGRELLRGGPHQPLVADQLKQGDGGP